MSSFQLLSRLDFSPFWSACMFVFWTILLKRSSRNECINKSLGSSASTVTFYYRKRGIWCFKSFSLFFQSGGASSATSCPSISWFPSVITGSSSSATHHHFHLLHPHLSQQAIALLSCRLFQALHLSSTKYKNLICYSDDGNNAHPPLQNLQITYKLKCTSVYLMPKHFLQMVHILEEQSA